MTEPQASTFRAGARTSLPITLGYFPIGLSFGVAATRAGFAPIEAVFVSAAIYAGAAQFLVLALVTGGAPILVAAASVLATNLRHLLYGPAILEKAGPGASTRWSWAWGFGLTDGAFGAAFVALSRRAAAFSERWMFGVALWPYLAWVSGTFTGTFLGDGALSAYPAVDAGLGFLLPSLFLAMLLPLLSRKQVPVVVVAGIVTIVVSLVTSTTNGIIAGMVAGSIAGMVRKSDATAP